MQFLLHMNSKKPYEPNEVTCYLDHSL